MFNLIKKIFYPEDVTGDVWKQSVKEKTEKKHEYSEKIILRFANKKVTRRRVQSLIKDDLRSNNFGYVTITCKTSHPLDTYQAKTNPELKAAAFTIAQELGLSFSISEVRHISEISEYRFDVTFTPKK